MIKYLTSQKYRLKKQELAELSLLNNTFEDFDPFKVRTFIRTMAHFKFQDELMGCFVVLRQFYAQGQSFQILKTLCFFHLIIQEVPQKCEEILAPEINKLFCIIEKEEKEKKKKSKERTRKVGSLSKTFDWFKERLNTPPVKQKHKRTQSMKGEEDPILSKEDFLMSKINKPYIVYLVKSITHCGLYEKYKGEKSLQFHEAWIIIRLLKQMLVLSNCFSQAGRYFKSELFLVVQHLRPILSFEVNFLYPLLKTKVESYNFMIEKKYLECHKQKDITQLVMILTKQYSLKDVVELLKQISKINEDMQFLYLSKYFPSEKKDNFSIPKFLPTSSPIFDLVFQLYKISNEGYLLKEAVQSQTEPSSERIQKRPRIRKQFGGVISSNMLHKSKIMKGT